ncbi:hypothetical protein ACFL4G_09780 [Thermodesulfobacteriota bacterium]
MMTGKILIAGATILAALTAVPGFSGEWEALSEEERRKLDNGEILCRTVTTDAGEGKIEGTMQSMVKIDASLDKCWELFTQFEKHNEFLPKQTDSIVVEEKSRSVFVLKKFIIFGRNVDYVIHYRIDAEGHRIDYELDRSRPHDIEDAAGYFLFEEISPDACLMAYGITRLDTGMPVPGLLQRLLQKRDLPGVVENVKKRIESGGRWQKDG